MANVNAPTATQVRNWTGLTRYLVGNADDTALAALIDEHVTQAEVDVALAVGEAGFDGTSWTARQAAALTRAWGYRAAASFLQQPYVQRVTGTEEPLLMEDAEAIAAVKAELLETAERLEQLAQSGVQTTEDAAFRMPSFGAAGVTYEPTTDATPLDRLVGQDESDNVSASEDFPL